MNRPSILRTLWPLACLACGLISPLGAEGLRREWLPADAYWVAHLDVEGVNRSVLGRAATLWSEKQDVLASRVSEFQERFHLHPLKDLRGLTLYGSSAAPENAVMIAIAGARMDGLQAKLRAQPEHVLSLVEGLEVHTWTAGALPLTGPSWAWFGTLEEGDRRVLVTADRIDLLTSAVALVRGAADAPRALPSNEDAHLQASPGSGANLYLEVGRGLPELLGRLPDSRLVRQARRVQVMLGEQDGRAQAFVCIGTGSRANSRDVADILRGGLRLLRLTLGSNGFARELAKRVDDVRVQEKRAEVYIHFRGPALELAGELAVAFDRWLNQSDSPSATRPPSDTRVGSPD